MARLRNLYVRIGADTSELTKGLKEASDAVSRAGARMTSLGGDLSVKVTAPILAIGTAAVMAFANFETAMVGVAKTIDAPAESIAALGQRFRDLSEEIPVSANELANIAAEAGQLGIQLENIGGFTEVVAGLRVTTDLGEEAGSTLAQLANIMGTAQTEFDRMGSSIVALGNTLATTESKIAAMSLRLAGAGKQIGLTEAQVFAFAGALSSVGIEADAGGSAFSKVMIDIASAVASGGEKVKQFADVAGMSTAAFSERFRTDAAGAILDFITGLDRMSKSGENVFGVLDELGLSEIRVRDALLRASAAGELFTNALETGSVAWQENNALAAEAEKFYNRTAAQFDVLKNRVINLAAEFGEALKPQIDQAIAAANRMIDVARGLIERFKNLSPETQALIVKIAAFAAAIGPVLVAVGTLTTVLGMVLNPIGLVVTAVAALTAAWALFGDDIKRLAGEAFGWLQGKLESFGSFFAEYWPALLGPGGIALVIWRKFGDDIRAAVGKLVGEAVDWGKNLVQGLIDGLQDAVAGAVGRIRDFGTQLASAFKGVLGISSPSKVFRELGREVAAGVAEGIQGSTNVAVGAVTDLADALTAAFNPDLRVGAASGSPLGALALSAEETTTVLSAMRERVDAVNSRFARMPESLEKVTVRTVEVDEGLRDLGVSVYQLGQETLGGKIMLEGMNSAAARFGQQLLDSREKTATMVADLGAQFQHLGATQQIASDMVAQAGLTVAASFSPLSLVALALGGVFNGLKPVIEALQAPIKIVAEIFGRALRPVLELLFPVFKGLGIVATFLGEVFFRIAQGIATAIGWAVRAIGKAIDALPFVSGKSIIKAGESLLNAAQGFGQSAKEMAEGRQAIRDLTLESGSEPQQGVTVTPESPSAMPAPPPLAASIPTVEIAPATEILAGIKSAIYVIADDVRAILETGQMALETLASFVTDGIRVTGTVAIAAAGAGAGSGGPTSVGTVIQRPIVVSGGITVQAAPGEDPVEFARRLRQAIEGDPRVKQAMSEALGYMSRDEDLYRGVIGVD